jgi:hypothetical protein
MTEQTLTANTVAPEWHQLGEPHYDANPSDDGAITVASGFTALIFASGGLSLEGSRWMLIVSFAAAIGFILAVRRWKRLSAEHRARIVEGRAAVLAYRADVSGWLVGSYGIPVGEPQVRKLLAGESLATDGPTAATISLIKSASGRLAIVDENRKPLQHIAAP